MRQIVRHWIQAAAAFLTNPYLGGFFTGKIWQGQSKSVCVPGLNCYSCPAAAGACPIGSLQAVLGGNQRRFSAYVLGLLLFFGALLGRVVCGFLCPFGFFQDLLHKIGGKRWILKVPPRLDRPLRWLKYFFLVVFVVALPMLAVGALGVGTPYFCKYVCPAGILEGGIPLALTQEAVRASLGLLFAWKFAILLAVIVLSVVIYRPFCKYICPLGAFYGLFNRIALARMNLDREKCIRCHACEKSCPMQVPVLRNINSAECIRCQRCASVCPTAAITANFLPHKKRGGGSQAADLLRGKDPKPEKRNP